MKIHIFKNMTGLIHGADPKRIGCDKEGELTIGATKVSISPDQDAIMPILYNGWTGEGSAAFTDKDGNLYDLGTVTIKSGRIVKPRPEALEMAELRARVDLLEDECASLWEKLRELANIFDTDSLNFLIK